MKRRLTALSQRYVTELRKHLQQGRLASFQPARRLGREAVSLGLETLDVARIHSGALTTLKASASQDGIVKRAELFFSEAVTPIERTHRAALRAAAHLNRVNEKLDRRTAELAATNRSLKEGIARRKAVERALKKSGGQTMKLLEESRCLQKHLRSLTHQIFTAQEEKRKKLSRDLQDEIAQTLLAINVRLLAVKRAANATGVKRDIARTQKLVLKARKSMKGLVREIGKQ